MADTQEVIRRVQQLATVEQGLSSVRDLVAANQEELRRVHDKLDAMQTAKRVDPDAYARLEGRQRLLELALATVGIYEGWASGLIAP